MMRPVFCEITGSRPSAFSLAQMSAVRRSCQTMARCTACPVARSHTTVVSRWLVMPIAAMSFALMPAWAISARETVTVEGQMCSGSCSTQPEAGKCCGNSACAVAAMEMSPRNTIAREEVVPWSMARTKDMEAPLGFAGRFLGVVPGGIIVSRQRERIRAGRSRSAQLSCRRRPGPIPRDPSIAHDADPARPDFVKPLPVVIGPGLRRDHELRDLRRRRGHAAVDDDVLSGHEARRVGGEVGHCARDFVGFADAAKRRGGGAAF